MNQTLKPVTAFMSPELKQSARNWAAWLGISLAELVRRAVADYLEGLQNGTIPQAAQRQTEAQS